MTPYNLSTPPNLKYQSIVFALMAGISLPSYADIANTADALNTAQTVNKANDLNSTNSDNAADVLPLQGNDTHTNAESVFVDDNSRILSKRIISSKRQRLGEWLSQELETDNRHYYEPATLWAASSEIKPQQLQQAMLSQRIEQLALKNASSRQAGLRALQHWVTSLDATGRVVLPKQDARYLQVNPSVEPVVAVGDTLIMYQRPDTVTVLFDEAKACQVSYDAGVRAKDYIDSCMLKLGKKVQVDTAYLILADGTVHAISLAKWNAKQQMAPSVGAWLWVPNAANHWSDDLATQVAQFIATQGINLAAPNGQDNTVVRLVSQQPETARDLPISSSDWGVAGLLQTPSARMQKQGSLVTHVSHVSPYTQYNISLQPFERLETTVRYSNISGVSYGPVSPEQDLKDKSLDVKLKLVNEGHWLPEVAVGWRDMAGTSLFAGEYVVANKRYGDFDVSLGLGWGYLGARGNIENPLGSIDEHFKQREVNQVGQGGKLSAKSWFTGSSSLFGGVQWHTPYDPLTLKVEYDGNDYKNEPYSNTNYNTKNIPVNVGLTWQDKDRGVAVSAGFERGDTVMLGVSLQGDLSTLGQVKPKAYQVQNLQKLPNTQYSGLKYRINLGAVNEGGSNGIDDSINTPLLNAFSQATGWRATDITMHQGEVRLNVDNYGGVFINERLQQGMEILRQALPADTKLIHIQVSRYGEAVGVLTINPQTWSQQYLQLLPPSQRIEHPVTISAASHLDPEPSADVVAHTALPKGTLTFSPSIQQSIGGPDGYLYGVFANANVDYPLWQGAWLDGNAQLRLLDNYDHYSYTADSKLPRVRTNIGDYMTTSRILMPNLQLNQFKSLGANWYGLAYAGYLESMYAGVGAEVMYRQPNQPWAVGIDLNHVRKRDFNQHFGLQDYNATTGNVSLYWDTPWYDIAMKLSAGQYLAGDKGATLDMSRQFNNGVKMGGWLTKTDVSSEDFGEGSLDKGIYVSIPFDTLFKPWASGSTTLVYQPLIRDGGAMLNRRNQLIQLTSPLDKSALAIKNPLAP